MSKQSVYKKLVIDLLNCAELNQEDLEPETLDLIEEANMTLLESDSEEEVFDSYEDDESDDVYEN